MNRFSECGTFSGRSTSAFSTLKTTALAPMASASVSTAVTANPGALRNWRRASRKSAFMLPPRVTSQRTGLFFCPRARADSQVYARSKAAVPLDISNSGFQAGWMGASACMSVEVGFVGDEPTWAH